MSKAITLLILAVSISSMVGCGSGVKTVADLNNTNIMRLHSAYKIYMNSNSMRGPKSEEELKEFLTSNNTAKALLKRMNITPEDVPGFFVSERDNQPFKVRWGLNGVADHAIVFEDTGIDGMRMVALSKPRELDDSEYEGYWSGEIKPQAPGSGGIIVEPDVGDGESE